MRKSKKIFFFFGLPLLCFMVFIAIIYVVLHFLWFMTFAAIVLISIYRRDRKYITLTKLALVMFLWFVFICYNPAYWGQQISRHLDRGQLITPDAQCITNLNTTFVYSPFYNGPYNRSTLEGQMQELSDVQFFLYSPNENPDDWINYTYDFFQYPGVFDHIPIPEEVLANRQDDCDGIAVVTVSLLVRLGYEAYVAESDSHWWTYVKIYGENLNASIRGKTYTVVYLNWREGIGEPYLIFNQTRIIIMQPLWISWWDQMTDGYYITIIQEFGLPLLSNPVIWIGLPFTLFILGFLFSFGVSFPRHYPSKKMHFSNTFLATGVLAALLAILLILPQSWMSSGTFILLGSITLLALIIDRDYLNKWIWRNSK
ncbi:MAG: hypothetical protein ACTSQ8_11250 [Candidatus Helarchaeota archaeon]